MERQQNTKRPARARQPNNTAPVDGRATPVQPEDRPGPQRPTATEMTAAMPQDFSTDRFPPPGSIDGFFRHAAYWHRATFDFVHATWQVPLESVSRTAIPAWPTETTITYLEWLNGHVEQLFDASMRFAEISAIVGRDLSCDMRSRATTAMKEAVAPLLDASPAKGDD